MDLTKKLLLFKHIDTFIMNQYSEGKTTEEILDVLNTKSKSFERKVSSLEVSSIRHMYLTNYSLFLKKRIMDFQYFRKKQEFIELSDLKLFNLIHFRDKLIFTSLFK